MARISREERLGKLRVQLTTGKMVNLEQLRNFARPVLVVGSKEAVEQNMAVRALPCRHSADAANSLHRTTLAPRHRHPTPPNSALCTPSRTFDSRC
jgi:hypothetical protein